MAVEILIPKLGLTMTEGVIEEWVATPGALVRVGDILMRLGTDKVDVDVEAEAEGVFAPHVQAGVVLPPGALAGWLLAEGEQPPTPPPAPEASPEPTAAAASPAAVSVTAATGGRLLSSPNARRVARELDIDIATVRGTGPGGRIVSEDVERDAAAAPAAAPAAEPAAAERPVVPGFASPLVRRLAETHAIDLADVQPSGAHGRIRRADVELAAERSARPAPAGPAPGAVIPLTGMRGAIARNMHASLQSMAQLTLGREVDVSRLLALRSELKADNAALGLATPTLTDFTVKAVALALRRHPLLNASVRDDAVVLATEVHVGLAVALPGGLVVPVLRDADRRSLTDLSREAKDLAAAARGGSLGLPDMEGGTFTVSSLGPAGIDFFTPVISPGNVAILGIGRVKDGVTWDGDTPRRTEVTTLSLTFDHRAVDGAPAAEFLATVADLLGRPLLLLAG